MKTITRAQVRAFVDSDSGKRVLWARMCDNISQIAAKLNVREGADDAKTEDGRGASGTMGNAVRENDFRDQYMFAVTTV